MEKKTDTKKAKHKVKDVRVSDEIKSDVLGSYTGLPENPDDRPVQDADDL